MTWLSARAGGSMSVRATRCADVATPPPCSLLPIVRPAMDEQTTTIYGASDDLIEFDGAIDGEAGAVTAGGESTVILTAPDGATLMLMIGFCTRNPDGWSIAVETHGAQSPSWPMRFVPAPGDRGEGDPAIEITHPEGTTATCDGENVQ